jgi:hypothetical protein
LKGKFTLFSVLSVSQAAEKEAALKEQKKAQRAVTKASKKGDNKPNSKGNNQEGQEDGGGGFAFGGGGGSPAFGGKGGQGKWSAAITGARTTEAGSRKRKVG